MMNDEEINQIFKDLDIEEEDLPEYTNPESFAQTFKKCSILEPHYIIEGISSDLSDHAQKK